jgi:hypothetical protein
MAEFVADKEPRSAVQILQDFANDPKIPTSLRISAASAAAPYETPKLLAIPGPVFLYSKIDIENFATIEDAESFLLNLSQREAAGELESASVQIVSDRVRAWIASKRAGQEIEIKRLNADQTTGETTVHITGGLPPLPMPPGQLPPILPQRLNGRDTQLLEPSNVHALNGPPIDSVALPSEGQDPETGEPAPQEPEP